jgi:hypothetical protein
MRNKDICHRDFLNKETYMYVLTLVWDRILAVSSTDVDWCNNRYRMARLIEVLSSTAERNFKS